MTTKNYNIKVYTLAWAYVRTFAPTSIMNGVSFTSQIGGGQGEFRCNLNLAFASVSIAYNNIIKVYEADDANPTGRIIYTGIVGSLQRINESGAEYIEMRALGLASMLSWVYYDAAGVYSFAKNQDPSLTIKDIVDRFTVKYPGLMTYDANSVETTGTTANLSFAYDKANGAAIKTAATASQWWWTVDGAGKFHFHPKTGAIGQTHHKLDMNYDVDWIKVEESLEKLVNKYIIDYTGGSGVVGSDATSQAAYGVRELYESHTEITNGTTATAAVAAYIAENKDPTRRVTVTVNSNYDIESIEPGDLVTIRNFEYSISALQISKIEYNPDNIKLELEDIFSVTKEIFTK